MTVAAYYDGSGNTSDPRASHIVLAGFCATPEAWAEFGRHWSGILDQFSIPYVHMREVYHRKGPFRGWTGHDYSELCLAVYNDCLHRMFGWGKQFAGTVCAIDLAAYRRACADYPGLATYKEAEAYCVDFCVTTALKMRNDVIAATGDRPTVELLFDVNERFMHMVNRVWARKARRKADPVFQSISRIGSVDMQSAKPVQAADFMAWHANRAYSKKDDGMLFYSKPYPFVLVEHAHLGYDRIVDRYLKWVEARQGH